MDRQARIFEFFGSLPGLLVLAALVVAVILIVVLRRLRAGRLAQEGSQGGAAAKREPPRWVEAAVAACILLEQRPRPSASPWSPASERTDPWRIAGSQGMKIGAYK
jgi:hypothetical protein